MSDTDCQINIHCFFLFVRGLIWFIAYDNVVATCSRHKTKLFETMTSEANLEVGNNVGIRRIAKFIIAGMNSM